MRKPFCLSHLTNVEGLKLNLMSYKTFKKSIKIIFNQIRSGRKFIYRKDTSVTTRAKHGLSSTLLQTFKFDKQTYDS